MTVAERKKMERSLSISGIYVHRDPDGSWYEVSKYQKRYGFEYSLWVYQPVGNSGVVESNCVTCSWRLQDIVDLL